MARSGCLFLLLLLAVSLGGGPAEAAALLAAPKTNWASRAYARLRSLQQSTGGFQDIRLSPKWGSLQIISGGFITVSGSTPLERARQFLTTYGDLFGIPADLSGIQLIKQTTSALGNHVAFIQTSGGFPVAGSELVVHMDSKGRIFRVTSNFVPNLSPSTGPVISSAAAIAAVYKYLGKTPTATDHPRAKRYVYASPSVQAPAWEVWLRRGPSNGVWQYFIDATTGKILQMANRSQHVTGFGSVFNPSPIKTLDNNSTSPINYAAFDAKNGTDYFTGAQSSVYFTVVLQGLETNGVGSALLSGPSVSVTQTVGVPQPFPYDFRVHRNNPQFTEVMAYYWIDALVRYIQNVIGAGVPAGLVSSLSTVQVRSRIDNTVFVSAIDVQVHDVVLPAQDVNGVTCCVDGSQAACATVALGQCLQGPDQSYYDPAEPAIHLLDGTLTSTGGTVLKVGVPVAEDADVILHEYAHAFQDGMISGGCCTGVDAQAMGEGFADYQAAMFAQVNGRGGRDPAAFAPWANAPPTLPGGPLRRLDGDANYSTDFTCATCNDPHVRGQIWSAALWDIKNRLGLRVANRAIYLHQLLLPDGMEDMPLAANAMILANGIADGGLGSEVIRAVFTQRGILPAAGFDANNANPAIVSAKTINAHLVQITFNEQLNQATVNQNRTRNGPVPQSACETNQKQNFAVTGPSGDHVVTGVAQVGAGIVNVTLSDAMRTDETPTIHVIEVADLVGKRMPCSMVTATDGTPPAVTSASATSRSTIQIVFSENLDATSVGLVNFKISGNHPISAVSASGNTVNLTTSIPLGTTEVAVVTLIKAIKDAAGNQLNPGIPAILAH